MRSSFLAKAVAAAGVAVLATTISVALQAPASASTTVELELCNSLSSSGAPAVDAWAGSTFLGKAQATECTVITTSSSNLPKEVSIFVDNTHTEAGSFDWTGNITVFATGSVNSPRLLFPQG